ncbi:hypothetical protein NPIL_594591 [Nephila pilipes]|uniref:Uncharacterized protein n=1 Tax=Nephila pilipes TaxID=299642 RepID=A0A8X6IBI7_NEPPI|nr:hypothetical protein NPIL_594591 [Nephila pilipes]
MKELGKYKILYTHHAAGKNESSLRPGRTFGGYSRNRLDCQSVVADESKLISCSSSDKSISVAMARFVSVDPFSLGNVERSPMSCEKCYTGQIKWREKKLGKARLLSATSDEFSLHSPMLRFEYEGIDAIPIS